MLLLSVTATCVHWLVASGVVVCRICSPPPPLVVIAKRNVPLPELGDRNMYCVVSLPKSKIRCHALPPSQFTHMAIVKFVTLAMMPAGTMAYWLVPLRSIAEPYLPATKVGAPFVVKWFAFPELSLKFPSKAYFAIRAGPPVGVALTCEESPEVFNERSAAFTT